LILFITACKKTKPPKNGSSVRLQYEAKFSYLGFCVRLGLSDKSKLGNNK